MRKFAELGPEDPGRVEAAQAALVIIHYRDPAVDVLSAEETAMLSVLNSEVLLIKECLA